MLDLNNYYMNIAVANSKSRNAILPLLSWDIYSMFFRNLLDSQQDFTLLDQLSKANKWDIAFDLNEELKMNDAVIVTNTNLQIVFASHGITEMSGYMPSEVVGNSPKMFQGTNTSAEKRAEINQAILARKPFEATLINYKKNGDTYDCHIRSFPIFNKKGELTHFIALEKAA